MGCSFANLRQESVEVQSFDQVVTARMKSSGRPLDLKQSMASFCPDFLNRMHLLNCIVDLLRVVAWHLSWQADAAPLYSVHISRTYSERVQNRYLLHTQEPGRES